MKKLIILSLLLVIVSAPITSAETNSKIVDSSDPFRTNYFTLYRMINSKLIIVENALTDFEKVYSKFKDCIVIWLDAKELNSIVQKKEDPLKIDIEKTYKKAQDCVKKILKKMDNESDHIFNVVDLLILSLNDCYEKLNFVRQTEVLIRFDKIISRMERIKYGTPKGTDTKMAAAK